tara:strand:- start:11036 stop:11467 length:432 start_codon:yes stop_codon:yes gene_type:complete
MVHALCEAYRILTVSGCVIDIRPFFPGSMSSPTELSQKVFCVTEEDKIFVGTLMRDFTKFYFADLVIDKTIKDNNFLTTYDTNFVFRYYLDSTEVFDRYRANCWDKASLGPQETKRLNLLMENNSKAIIQVDTPVQIRVLKKQ